MRCSATMGTQASNPRFVESVESRQTTSVVIVHVAGTIVKGVSLIAMHIYLFIGFRYVI
jgi:hypothetical protein